MKESKTTLQVSPSVQMWKLTPDQKWKEQQKHKSELKKAFLFYFIFQSALYMN